MGERKDELTNTHGHMPRLAYRQAEVAYMLGCSPSFVRQLIDAGRLKARTEGRAVWITAKELDRFLDERNGQE
jgi:excisionase family DNA binding protein